VAAQPPPSDAAPQVAPSPGPAEAGLSPGPETDETTALPPGLVVVENPAFPPRVPVAVVPPVDPGPAFDEDSLDPYFAQGNRALAKAAYDAGQLQKTLDLLAQEGDAIPVRYLRALARQRMGDNDAAAPEWEALGADYPALANRCWFHAGIAREALGQLAAAKALYARIPNTSRLYPDARLGLFRVTRRSGDTTAAVEALAPLLAMPTQALQQDVAADALNTLADLAHARKDVKGERAYLFRLWSEHPLSGLAKDAAKRLKGIPVPLASSVARAEALINANRNLDGLKILKPLLPKLKLPDPLACSARFSYGKGLRKMREHSRAEAELVPVVAQCKDDNLRPRAMYVLGSSQSIINKPAGVKTYDAIAADYPEHPFADDALFYGADLELKLGHPDEAVARLERLAQKYPDGDFASEALFKSFWIARSQDKRAEAMGFLDTIEKRYADAKESYDVERERYWRARMVEKADPKAANALLTSLAQDHPGTYYGLISRQRLADTDPKALGELGIPAEVAQVDGSIWPLHAGTMAKDAHFQAGIELLRLGFADAAVPELMAVDRTEAPNEAVRLLVYAVSKAGDAKAAHALARVSLRSDLGGRITAGTRPFWEIAYPPAFREQVVKYCEEAKFDPDLLQALMREESALDPNALSWAGAIGLTQLMPSTARSVARTLKLRRPTTTALLDPDLNLHLGATYLGGLLKRFGGNPFYALASYNAGPGAVNAWRAANPQLALDEWVEEIPIAETRGYVKRVLRSYNTYHLLYPAKVPGPGQEGLPVR